jgi:hypothetical protein
VNVAVDFLLNARQPSAAEADRSIAGLRYCGTSICENYLRAPEPVLAYAHPSQ